MNPVTFALDECHPRDKREVSTGSAPAQFHPPAPPRTASTTLSEADHRRIARRHGGCPITYRTTDGRDRAAIRLPGGEILIYYLSDLTYLTACLAEALRLPGAARL